MSSTSEKKSPQEMIAQAQRMIQSANTAQPCVAVTEPNWKAMIQTQRAQIDLLSELQKTQTGGLNELKEALQTLTTKDEIVDYLRQQLDELERYTEAVSEATTEYQKAMRQDTSRINSELDTAMKNAESRAGRMSENFSNCLLQEQKSMKKYTRKLFWIAMIPSIFLMVLELTRFIWLAVLPQ